MQTPQIYECDVVVVGLGPTGAMLANLLGQYGWTVVALERDIDVYPATRAVHFDDEAMRIFQFAGLSREVERISEPFTEMEFKRTADAKPLLKAAIGSQDRRYGYAGAWWFHQPTLEVQLREKLKRYPKVKLFYGFEVCEIIQTADCVVAVGRSGSGESVRVAAKFLVGCDGGRSFVRRAAAISLDSANFDECWVVVDTKTRSGEKEQSLPSNHAQICNPRQPVTYVPVAGPHYRWELMVANGRRVEEATDPALVRQQLREFVDLEKIEIVRIACYNFHCLWAQKWISGRIALAGDAAHQMPPFLGQGMCSGLRDAHGLSWRLDLILSGRSSPDILADYFSERSQHVHEITRGAMFIGNLIQTRNRFVAFLRDNFIFRVVNRFGTLRRAFINNVNRKRPLKAGCIGTHRTLAGHLAIQPLITMPDGRVALLDEALGHDFAVLARNGTLQGSRLALNELCKALPARVLEFDSSGQNAGIADHTGALEQWFTDHQIDFVLVRPDRYIFEAGSHRELELATHNLLTRTLFGNATGARGFSRNGDVS